MLVILLIPFTFWIIMLLFVWLIGSIEMVLLYILLTIVISYLAFLWWKYVASKRQIKCPHCRASTYKGATSCWNCDRKFIKKFTD